MFGVDEVVIFDDGVKDDTTDQNGDQRSSMQSTSAHDFLALLLSYLETPPHMRRRLFPMNPDLRKAGLLPSLDMPHHLRRDEWCQYREGVTLSRAEINSNRQLSPGYTSVDVGLEDLVEVEAEIPPNTRITIKFPGDITTRYESIVEAVAPSAPREQAGWYWGYEVRQASMISDVFTECPWEGGYDISIGTSERGQPIQEVLKSCLQASNGKLSIEETINGEANTSAKIKALCNYSHLLLVFGGHQGLEVALRNDSQLRGLGVEQPAELFDWWINLHPGQSSRTIRTEEAIWLGLMAFQGIVDTRSKL